MVQTIKFSQFTSAGLPNIGDTEVGLRSGANTNFTQQWTWYPPGNTASRPTSPVEGILRFNTESHLYEYFDALTSAWQQLVITPGDSGTVLPGLMNQIAYYAADGNTVSGTFTLPSIVQANISQLVGLTGSLQAPTFIADSLGNKNLSFTYSLSAVNFFVSQNASSGTPPLFSATGTDTNVGFFLATKGNLGFQFQVPTGTTILSLQPNSSTNVFTGSFSLPTITANRTYTLKDASGTIAFTSDLTGFVTSVSGTSNRITSTGGTTPVIDISASYVGQSSITTLGTVTTGTWNAGAVTSGANPITSGTPTGGNAYFQTYSATSGNGWLQLIAANSSGNFGGVFTNASLSNTRTWTFPDASGTVALTSQLPSGAALTKTDDTNVTLTLGGSPTVALLAATSLTLGWTGTLSGTRGGTGVNNGSSTITIGGNITFSGANTFTGTLTADTSVTFPTSGTLATTSQLPSASALTKTDDTNVTLTLGGSPTVALLAATSLTLGWTGQLSFSRGGTNASLIASNGGIVYSTASAMAILGGTATAGLALISGSNTTPSWSASAPLLSGNNLSDLASKNTAKSNLNTCMFIANTAGHANVTGDGTSYVTIFELSGGTNTPNIGSNYNTSTGVFTAPVTGNYIFFCTWGVSNLGAAHISDNIYIVNNNSTLTIQLDYSNPFVNSNGGALISSAGGLLHCTANDTVNVITTVSGSTKTVNIPSGMTFSGYLIG